MRGIPRGRVATYGQVARLAGLPRQARQVGYALHALPDGSAVPWHRVVNARGAISPRAEPGWTRVQQSLLEAEGIRFGATGTVSLERYGWRPSRSRVPSGPHTDGGLHMGKGDRKSRKGKIWRGSFGKRRPRKKKGKGAKPAAS